MIGKANHKTTRAHNKRLILKTIYNAREISRANVARDTDLTRATVSDAVAELMKEGLVREIGTGKSTGGKPPRLLSVVENSRYLICIDLADSEFCGAGLNLRGKIRNIFKIPIMDSDGKTALSLLYQLIEKLIQSADCPILGIGIGAPGLIDSKKGIVKKAVNLDWHDLPLKEILEEKYNLPVYIANDCQVAALAECTFGGSKNFQNLIVIKVGRGTGAGIVINGKIYYGDGFGAGEIGHVKIVENGDLCSCGNIGCLETLTSTRAIIRSAKTIFQQNKDSLLHNFSKNPDEIDMETVFKAFETGDKETHKIVSVVGHYLGIAVANLIGALNIKKVIIAGSLSRFGEALIEPIKAEVKRRALRSLANETEVEISKLGAEIVILGAGALLLANQLGLP
ncbi:MAG: ROK family protein [Candidatus Aminicenantia bacterium]